MIVRNVMMEIICDHQSCEACFEVAGPDMAVYKTRQLAQEQGWYSRSRTNGVKTVDYCPEHWPAHLRKGRS